MQTRFILHNDDLQCDKCDRLIVIREEDFGLLLQQVGTVWRYMPLTRRQKVRLQHILVIKKYLLTDFEQYVFYVRYELRKSQDDASVILREMHPVARKMNQDRLCVLEKNLKKKVHALFMIVSNRKQIQKELDPSRFEKELFYWLILDEVAIAADNMALSYCTALERRSELLRKIMASNLSVSIKEAFRFLLVELMMRKTRRYVCVDIDGMIDRFIDLDMKSNG